MFVIPTSTAFNPNNGALTQTVNITTQSRPVLNGSYTISASSTSINIGPGFNTGGKWTSGTGFNYIMTPPDRGSYIGTNRLGGISGEWLKVQCPVSFVPTAYTVRTNYNSGSNQVVERHAFLGSTNNTTWIILNNGGTIDGNKITTTEATFTINTTNSYNYYALIINKIIHANGTSNTSGECVVGMGVKGVF